MIYRFWETPTSDCLIEIIHDGKEDGERAYITDMIDFYHTEHGRQALLGHTDGWGTVNFTKYDIRELKCLGRIETKPLTLSANDKSVLSRCIDKEGFNYAMFDYSDYQSVERNVVQSREFHELRNGLIDAKSKLQTWLRMQGIDA
ncbi:hypothetical protein VPFG_00246 [Vibrio phage nt-1]|uniref:Uncharacterized protein n=1 Tax=Vibrio phage nt-1 TaxID=115992 RepID=R9TIN5_9CAUD|nr:hypothetical protein VPFG_00246 [Vibrio phage nt-1]AGN30245.1 hypothetical protein VPFG_00246 [Vibrio phage nt-1]